MRPKKNASDLMDEWLVVRITKGDLDRLKLAAAKSGAPVSWLVRWCIRFSLKKAVQNLSVDHWNTDGDVSSDKLTGRAE